MEIEPKYVDSSVRRWVKHMKANNLEFVLKRNGETLDNPLIES